MAKAANPSNLKPGDRVIAIDSAGCRHRGHLHHANPCGQFYVLPDSARQPFYAFPRELTAMGERQPGFVSLVYSARGAAMSQNTKRRVL